MENGIKKSMIHGIISSKSTPASLHAAFAAPSRHASPEGWQSAAWPRHMFFNKNQAELDPVGTQWG